MRRHVVALLAGALAAGIACHGDGPTGTDSNLDLENSSLAVAQGPYVSGQQYVATFSARDGRDRPYTKNVPVAFSLSGGTSAGTFSPVTQGANGTYSVTFTAVTAGTPSQLHLSVNGQAIPDARLPSITVVAAGVSAAHSLVSAAPTSIVAGGAPSTITVTARDANNNPVVGAPVVLGATGSGNSLTQPGSVTDANGMATGALSATTVGVRTVSATVGTTALTATAQVTVAPGTASGTQSTIAVTPASIVAGVGTSAITVTARDANGNPIAGATVQLGATGAGNALTQPATVTDANGVATGSFASTVAGTKTISATVNGVAVTPSANIVVTPGAISATHSTIAVNPASMAAGGAAGTITVTARDANDNPVAGAPVVLSATGTSNSLTQPASATGATGIATGSITSTVAGTRTISATAGGIALAQTAQLSIVAGPVSAAHSSASATPSSVTAGGAASTIAVVARDLFDNPIAGATVVLAASGAGNTVVQPSGPTDATGAASGTFASTVTGTKSVSVTIDGVAVPGDVTVLVTAGAVSATNSTVTASPAALVAGSGPSTVTVTARDAFNNTIGGAPVVLAATGTSNTLVQPVASTDSNGVATGTLASGVAGARTVSATVGGVAVTQVASVTFTAGGVSATHSGVVAAPASISTDGATSTITVTVRDANDNPIAGAIVQLSATGSGNTLTQPSIVTDATGVATGTLASTVVGSKTVSATADGVPLTPTAVIAVVAGAVSAAHSLVAAAPGSVIAGTATSTITVTARDANDNAIAGASVTLAASGAANVLTQPTGATGANGEATGTISSTAAGAKTISALVNGVAVTQTALVTVTPGPVSATTSTLGAAPPTLVAGGAPSTITVTARDEFGNAMSGATVVLGATGAGNTLMQPAGTTGADGVATGSLASVTAGAKVVSATVNGVSLTQTATLTVGPGAVSPSHSSLAASPGAFLSGGGSSTLTVTARDANDNAIAGATVVLAATGSGNTITQPAGVTGVNGVATGTLESADPGAKTVSATIDGVPIDATAVVTVTSIVVSPTLTTVAAAPTTLTAGGAASTITVTVRDTAGAPVAGASVTLAATGAGNTLTQPVGTTDANGVVTGSIASTVAGAKAITTIANGTAITQSPTVTVVSAAVSATHSSVAATPGTITAGGAPSSVTVVARDAFDNPVEGATVVLAASGSGNTLVQPSATTSAAGESSGSLGSTTAGPRTVSATIDGVAIVATAAVTVQPAAVSATQSTVSAAPTTIAAGGAASTITVTARDAFGNVIAGKSVALASSGTGNTLTQPGAVTDAVGATTGSLASTVAGSKTVSATIDGVAVVQTASVTVTPGAVSGATSTIQAAPTTLVASFDTSTITVTARDAAGNPVAGATVVISANGSGNVIEQPPAVTDANGIATGRFTSLVAGARSVTASIDGTPLTSEVSVSVVAGDVSPLLSEVAVAPGSVQAGGAAATITVTARDAFANPIAGAAVTLAASGSGNTVTQPGTATDTQGQATGTLASTAAGTKTISATVNGVALTATASLTVTAGDVSASHSTVAAGAPTLAAGAAPLTITVRALDANDNPIVGANVVLAATGTGNTLTQPVTVTDADGYATGAFSSTVAEGKTISATIAGVPAVQTAAVSVTAGAVSAAVSELSAAPSSITAGGTPSTITVTARDAFGNAIAGAAVVLAASGSGNSLTQPATVTDVNGLATGSLGATVVGARTVGATIDGVAVTQTAQVTVAAAGISAAVSQVEAAPGSITAGGTASTITVRVRDAFGNAIAGASVVLAASGTGNTLTQPAAVSDGAGEVTGTIASTVAEAKTISATADGVALTPTAPVTVSAAAVSAATSTLEAAPTAIIAGGTPSTLTATARDAFGNLVAGAGVSFGVTGGGNTLTPNAAVTDANGVATATLASTAAGTKTASVTLDGVAVTQTAQVSVTAAGVSAAQSLVSASPTSIAAPNTPSTITVTALDAFGNPVAGAAVTLAASGTGNSITQPSGATDANGVTTGALTSTVAGVKTVSATIDGVAIAATSDVTVVAGPLSTTVSTVEAAPTSVAAGAATSTITVTARDADGNPRAGATVVLAATGTGNTLTQPPGVTNASGVATGTLASTAAGSKSVTATVDGQALSGSATVTVTPGAASTATSLVTVTSGSIVVGTTTTVRLTAIDAFGNPLTTGGATVAFGLGTGTSAGTFGTVTSVGDGTYTSVFTATTVGTARTITATIGGVAVTTALPTITVTAPIMGLATDSVVVNAQIGTAGAPQLVAVASIAGGTIGGLSTTVNALPGGPASCGSVSWLTTPTFDMGGVAAPVSLMTIQANATSLALGTCKREVIVTSTTPGVVSRRTVVTINVGRAPAAVGVVNVVMMGDANLNVPQTITPTPVLSIDNGGRGTITGVTATILSTTGFSDCVDPFDETTCQPWLHQADLVLSSTTLPATLSIVSRVRPFNAAATIRVAGTGMTSRDFNISVAFNVEAELVTNPRNLVLRGRTGGATVTDSVLAFNQNKKVIYFAGQTNRGLQNYRRDPTGPAVPSWMTLQFVQGPADSARVRITADPSAFTRDTLVVDSLRLMADFPDSSWFVNGSDSTLSLDTVPKTFWFRYSFIVEAGLQVSLPNATLFAPFEGAASTQDLLVTNQGSGSLVNLQATVDPGAPWLGVQFVGGVSTTPATLRLTGTPTGLARGTYLTNVTVTSGSGPSLQTRTIPVRLTVF